MSIIAWILLGLIAGAIAKGLMPGDDPGGLIVTIAIGIAGAFIGGFLWNVFSGASGYGGLRVCPAPDGIPMALARARSEGLSERPHADAGTASRHSVS
jgi:uncharacterized membrane protein YeaQ/YmgE (transglycosylase-associated protein family)